MTLTNQAQSDFISVSNGNYRVLETTRQQSTSERGSLECVVSDTFNRLVKFYRSNISFEERRRLTVAPLKGRLDYKTSTVITEMDDGLLNLLELPSSLQLLVFSYLDVHSLCQLSQTCRLLRDLSSDHLLWGKILKRDLQKWTIINNQSHPQIYFDAAADLTPKQIYSRCQSARQQDRIPEQDSLTAKLLKFVHPYFYDKPPTRVVMFGPGLESSTSSIIKQLIWNKISPFKVQGLFPGQQDGIGSGVSLKYNDELLNLIILYSSTKKEREAAAHGSFKSQNKILLDKEQENGASANLTTEVTHPVRQLCKTIDAFIFVVDSSVRIQSVCETNDLLKAMMDERWTSKKSPLLVLSCASSEEEPYLSCADVADALHLCDMSRHWQVNRAVVDTLEGIENGANWLLKQCSS